MVSAVLQATSKELEQWPKIIEAASKSPLGIFALMLLLTAVLALAFFRKAELKYRMIVFLTMFVSLVLYGYSITRATDMEYRVRVIVLGADGSPINDAHVFSSLGGEPLKVEGGWMFIIPDSDLANRELTIYAEVKDSFEKGNQSLRLGKERNPTMTVQISSESTARLRGIVEDANRTAIASAQISIIGYEGERMLTGPAGGFELPAHSSANQQVQVHVEKTGYHSANIWCPAGEAPCEVVLTPIERIGGKHRAGTGR